MNSILRLDLLSFAFGTGRRRSVDNRDNGAPRDCIWHEAENTEAAVEIMNEL